RPRTPAAPTRPRTPPARTPRPRPPRPARRAETSDATARATVPGPLRPAPGASGRAGVDRVRAASPRLGGSFLVGDVPRRRDARRPEAAQQLARDSVAGAVGVGPLRTHVATADDAGP